MFFFVVVVLVVVVVAVVVVVSFLVFLRYSKLAHKWVSLCNFVIKLAYVPSKTHS